MSDFLAFIWNHKIGEVGVVVCIAFVGCCGRGKRDTYYIWEEGTGVSAEEMHIIDHRARKHCIVHPTSRVCATG